MASADKLTLIKKATGREGDVALCDAEGDLLCHLVRERTRFMGESHYTFAAGNARLEGQISPVPLKKGFFASLFHQEGEFRAKEGNRLRVTLTSFGSFGRVPDIEVLESPSLANTWGWGNSFGPRFEIKSSEASCFAFSEREVFDPHLDAFILGNYTGLNRPTVLMLLTVALAEALFQPLLLRD